jgi:uncharacterized small protein (DUF1192 family)
MSQKVSSSNGAAPASATPPASVTELREDIAQHRQELAQTVDALAAKLDVKSRAKARLVELQPVLVPALAGLSGLTLLVVVVRKWRS